MSLSSLLDIEGGIRSFFSSLSVSLSFNLMFIIGLSIEAAIILFFVIKSLFAYEMRATRSLDKLNKWLFVNKKLTTENIKEFTNLVKKGPKRLSYNWQQYILYREKAPSQYMTIENIVDKPLRASSYDSNIKNLGIFSYIFSAIMFLLGLAHSGAGETVLNTYLMIVAVSVPFIMLLMYGIARMSLTARKHSNLDNLYQNLHLFQRFIDNACVDLPQFIDFTLLFSPEEIEKGIPALREFLESRARKEKEEFDRARREMVEYEKYDFEKAGVDGSNILDRAMRESESYLNNKNKTLAKISQIEASLESLKKNFDNIQKDFQRKMQISKENIDRLRQSQEETTSRIESNYLRKQQTAELAKQEKEEADFEQQKRRYLVEKNDCEEEIKALNAELDSGKLQAEKAMLAEYQTFYTRVCKRAEENVDSDMREELTSLKQTSENTEEDLAQAETLIKRLEDENLTLRRKLESGNVQIDKTVTQIPVKREEKTAEKVEPKPAPVKEPVAAPVAQPTEEEYSFDEPTVYPDLSEERPVVTEAAPEVKEEVAATEEVKPEEYNFDNAQEVEYDIPEENVEVKVEEPAVEETPAPAEDEYETVEDDEEEYEEEPAYEYEEEPEEEEETLEEEPEEAEEAEEKRGRGRPRKNEQIEKISSKIKAEEKKAELAKKNANNELNEAIKGIDDASKKEMERQRLIAEIEELRKKTVNADESSPEELENISHQVEELLNKIQQLED